MRYLLLALLTCLIILFSATIGHTKECPLERQWPIYLEYVLENNEITDYRHIKDKTHLLQFYGGPLVDAPPNYLPAPDSIGYFLYPNDQGVALLVFQTLNCVTLESYILLGHLEMLGEL